MSYKPRENRVVIMETYFAKWIMKRNPKLRFNPEFVAECEREINGVTYRQIIYHGDGIYLRHDDKLDDDGKKYTIYSSYVSLNGIVLSDVKYL